MNAQDTSSLKSFITTALNKPQHDAVTSDAQSILVIAGAGSGKTRVITTRIAHLITERNVEPTQIIALTFTNRAAAEMKERIAQFIGSDQTMPFVGTFHSYCVRLLKRYQSELPQPFISILDEDDRQKLIRGILTRHNLQKQITPRQASYQISHLKTHLDPTDVQFTHPLMKEVHATYEKEKEASRCLDFDDLLITAVKLFKKSPMAKQSFQQSIRHILVDEYQDTNAVQHELLKQMACNDKKIIVDSVCAVGDEDQSIYSWRGATVANMLTFQKDFAPTSLIKIEQNYRSVQPILQTANHIIAYNTQRNPKKLWSDKKACDRIRVLTCLSGYQEADIITRCIESSMRTTNKSSIAILYRTHAQSRALEESLIKNSIPYKIVGGIQFYERKEIKDLIAYLRLIINPFDRPSFFRVINTPLRGLGNVFEELVQTHWQQEPLSSYTAILEYIKNASTKTKMSAIDQFLTVMDSIGPDDSPSKALDTIIRKTQYVQYINDSYEPADAHTRLENIKELQDAVAYFEQEGIVRIEEFLDEVALLQDKLAASQDEQEKVLLMTLHAAKGLEFDTVILSGLEEGTLPTARALADDDSLEEERRLLYVGITRARERLLITHAHHRYTYGKMVDQLSSRFVDELPATHIAREDASYWQRTQQQRFFEQWFGLQSERPVHTFSSFTAPGWAEKNSKIEKKKSATQTGGFRKLQPVKHSRYGIGTVKTVEQKGDKTYVTVSFKSGVKKIVASFLEKM